MTEATRDFEADYRKVMGWATDKLWELDAAEDAMEALYDVLVLASDRAEDAAQSQDRRRADAA